MPFISLQYEDEISSLLAEEETLKMNLDESSQTISLLREEVKDLKQEAHKNTTEFECKQVQQQATTFLEILFAFSYLETRV